jgi:hypothetical protein
VNRTKSFQQYFYNRYKIIHVTRIAAMHIIFTRIGCTLFMCDMYMCRIRHINDSVLSSFKMEGICLLFCFKSLNDEIQWSAVNIEVH